MTATSLPRYRCHKIVRAGKIRAIEEIGTEDRAYILHMDPDVFVRVSVGWIERHQPQVGGYFVVYDDALYTSYSPALAFENGYRLGASAIPDDVRAALLLAQAALENVNEPIDSSALDAVNTMLDADRQMRTGS